MVSVENRFKAVEAVLKLVELREIHFSSDKGDNPQQITEQFLDAVELIINRLDPEK